jgi:hypothetical protein
MADPNANPPAPPDAPPSPGYRLVEFLMRDAVLRRVAAVVLVWGWIHLVDFNLTLTREFAVQLNDQGFWIGRIGVPPEAILAVRAIYAVIGFLSVAALIATALSWRRLARLTRLLANLVYDLALRHGDPTGPIGAGATAGNPPDPLAQLAEELIGWFRCFAAACAILLLVTTTRAFLLAVAVASSSK